MSPRISSQMALGPVKDHRHPTGKMTLDQLPQEVLENIAGFCGNISKISPSEDADTFTKNLVKPYLDSVGSNTWTPSYKDLRSLALVSKAFANPAQRALFKIAMVKTTGHLMLLLRSLLLYPANRRYVRVFVAVLRDHGRPLPSRFGKPSPLVLAEFLHYLWPLITSNKIPQQPAESFFSRTVPLLEETLDRLVRTNMKFSLSLLDSTEINLHTVEDQLLTTVIQLLPKLASTRICFGLPDHNVQYNTSASQPVATPGGPPLYTSLLTSNHASQLRAITLDFGALTALTNLNRFASGYKAGLPSSIERLTLVGNHKDSNASYSLFNLKAFSQWLGTNKKLRELRMLHGFDQLVAYKHYRAYHNHQHENWNSVLLRYKDTLEVLVMDRYDRYPGLAKAKYGITGQLDCLSQMKKLRHFSVPLHALSGEEYGVPIGADAMDVTELMRTVLPPNWKTLDVACKDDPHTGLNSKMMAGMWRVFKFPVERQSLQGKTVKTL